MDTPSDEQRDHAATRHDGYSFSPLLPATDRGARNLVMLIAAMLFAACLSASFRMSTKLAECRQEAQSADGTLSTAALARQDGGTALPPSGL